MKIWGRSGVISERRITVCNYSVVILDTRFKLVPGLFLYTRLLPGSTQNRFTFFTSQILNYILDLTNGQADPRRWVGSGYFARRCQVA